MKNSYPDANKRMEYLDRYSTSERGVARDAIHWTLAQLDRFMIEKDNMAARVIIDLLKNPNDAKAIKAAEQILPKLLGQKAWD